MKNLWAIFRCCYGIPVFLLRRRPVLYTYHEDCPDLYKTYDARAMLGMWSKAWQDAGWEPVVLDRTHAQKHPLFHAFSQAVRLLPSLNSRAYEDACYFRWLAMAMEGGGFMADPDVFPLRAWEPVVSEGLTIFSRDYLEALGICPCFVHGRADDYEIIARHFLGAARWLGPLAHVSDQIILRRRAIPFRVRNDVLTFGDPALAQGFAVHFKTDAVCHLAAKKGEATHLAMKQLGLTLPEGMGQLVEG